MSRSSSRAADRPREERDEGPAEQVAPDGPTLPWLETPLSEMLRNRERLAHAYLLTGPHGIGKSILARRWAAALLCETPGADGRACGHCPACLWLLEGHHPDLRVLEPIDEEAAARQGRGAKASRQIRIPQVRELADFLAIGTHRGGRRIILIDPAEAMNREAANALLKSLEEPTPATHFMLVASRWQSLPATIVSRCVRIQIDGPGPAEVDAWLCAALIASGTPKAEAGARAATALAAAGGSPLLALGLADAQTGAVHRLVLETLAGLPETALSPGVDVLAAHPATVWIEILQAWVADLGRSRLGGRSRRFPGQEARLAQLAVRLAPTALGEFGRWLDQQRQVAEHPLNARLFCESVLLRYHALFGPTSPRGRPGR